MTTPTLLHSFLAVLIVSALVGESAVAGQFRRRDPKADYASFKDPAGQFAMEYPKDWRVTAGVGDVIATIAQKSGEAALVIERFKLRISLRPEEVTEEFLQLEADVLKERQPQATNVTGSVVTPNGPLIVLDYLRPGLFRPERARQYSLPKGQLLFRLTCSAATTLFVKYDPMFIHAAQTFKVEELAAPSGADRK